MKRDPAPATSDFDVAVIGLGPTGAVAAALLAQAGLSVLVVERTREVYDKPRAIALDHEILRLFQQLGVLGAVLPHCEAFTPSEYFGVDGRLIKRMTMVSEPWPLAHTPSMVFSQPPVEAALRAHLSAQPGVRIELGTALQSLVADADGVTLTLTDAEGTEQRPRDIRAAWLIGCDGASSTVRNAVGIALEDLDFDEPWLVVDVRINARGLARLPQTSVQYCEPGRPCTYVIGPGNHRRWEIALKPGEDPKEAATPEGTWRLLERWLTPEDGTLWRQASYRFHALVAREWRRGRVFIAGDAAHQQPPFLGQGMCQGIRDAANLAWKLAAVHHGQVEGSPAAMLLDSYGTERQRHVRELTRRIKAIGAVICERDVGRARQRDADLLAACSGVVPDTPRQDVMPTLDGGWLTRHRASARGTIFPQPWLLREGGRRQRFDEVAGPGWWLVADAALHDAAARTALSASSALHVLPVGTAGLSEADGVLSAWMQQHACHAALVRPDRYVFGTAATAAELQSLIREAHLNTATVPA